MNDAGAIIGSAQVQINPFNIMRKSIVKANTKNAKQSNSTIVNIMRRFKLKDSWTKFASLKSHDWSPVHLCFLLFYIITVERAAEITVKCRNISKKFDDPDVISLFVFFEMEVFAFLGILVGLLLWLIMKQCLNACFMSGPRYVFKTKGIRRATD